MQLWYRLVDFGFRLLYNEMAWSYDIVSWLVSLGEWRTWQFAALDFVEGERVLELAHGTGHLLLEMHRRGLPVIGLDFSPAMGRIARRRLQKAGIELPIIRATALTLPFMENSFDTVVATFPTEYIFEPETLQAVRRVLVPQGRLVIVLGGGLKGQGVLERLIKWVYVLTGHDGGSSVETYHQNLPPYLATQHFNLTTQPIEFAKSHTAVLIAHPIPVLIKATGEINGI